MEFTARKVTKLRAPEADSDGVISWKIDLEIYEGSTPIGRRTHAGTIEPGRDVRERMAQVNDNFDRLEIVEGEPLQYPPLSDEDIAKLESFASETWTPEILSLWDARRADEKARLEAEAAAQAEAEAVAQVKAEAAFMAMAERLGFVKK